MICSCLCGPSASSAVRSTFVSLRVLRGERDLDCRQTERWRWQARRDKFYLIMHEHLFVFRKPKPGERLQRLRDSTLLP